MKTNLIQAKKASGRPQDSLDQDSLDIEKLREAEQNET